MQISSTIQKCAICNSGGGVASIAKCAGNCKQAFHFTCLKLSSLPPATWKCEACTAHAKKKKSSYSLPKAFDDQTASSRKRSRSPVAVKTTTFPKHQKTGSITSASASSGTEDESDDNEDIEKGKESAHDLPGSGGPATLVKEFGKENGREGGERAVSVSVASSSSDAHVSGSQSKPGGVFGLRALDGSTLQQQGPDSSDSESEDVDDGVF